MCRLYDPGYVNTACCESKITQIDGERGILRYRGYDIEELVEKSTFLEVAYLLIFRELPDKVISLSAILQHLQRLILLLLIGTTGCMDNENYAAYIYSRELDSTHEELPL